MRKRILSTLATAAAFVGVVAAAPTASAEPSPAYCPKGYVCVYNGYWSGPTAFKSAGNWYGSYTFLSPSGGTVFNNGYPYPGADHIQVTSTLHGNTFETCLHYNPGPGNYTLFFGQGETLKSLVWRGEC